ncbi:MAG: hypothetical protein V9G04_18940 [Nocardioides sp.]|jgi:hypothetical protein
MIKYTRRAAVAALALVGATALAPTAVAVSPSDSTATNGVCYVTVRSTTANSVIKTVSVAVGPEAAGQTAPAGSTWNYKVQVISRPYDGVNLPTTSYSSYGTWSAPRITGKAPAPAPAGAEIYTIEMSFTSNVALSSTVCAPNFGWRNSTRPLRPDSAILVSATAPSGALRNVYLAPNQRNGDYVY